MGGKRRECLERVASLNQNPREKQAVTHTCWKFVGERLTLALMPGFRQERRWRVAGLVNSLREEGERIPSFDKITKSKNLIERRNSSYAFYRTLADFTGFDE
jgi:hypothetical protein